MNLDTYSAAENAVITVFHSAGKVVFQKQVQILSGAPIELDLTGQTAGVYLVQVQTDTTKETMRVIKR